jgi:hypothetical protein
MRALVLSVAALSLATSVSRTVRAWDDTAKEAAIERYEGAMNREAPVAIDPADMPPRDGGPSRRMPWYGWQTLTVDAGSLLLGVAGGQSGGGGGALLSVTGFLGYVAIAPAVHGFHHRDGALLLDMALRIGLPLLGAVASSHTYLPLAFFTPAGGAGELAGVCAAIGIDALLLSWDTRSMHADDTASSAWSPRISLGPQGATAGVGGTF